LEIMAIFVRLSEFALPQSGVRSDIAAVFNGAINRMTSGCLLRDDIGLTQQAGRLRRKIAETNAGEFGAADTGKDQGKTEGEVTDGYR
jgi:hypothetical protein